MDWMQWLNGRMHAALAGVLHIPWAFWHSQLGGDAAHAREVYPRADMQNSLTTDKHEKRADYWQCSHIFNCISLSSYSHLISISSQLAWVTETEAFIH